MSIVDEWASHYVYNWREQKKGLSAFCCDITVPVLISRLLKKSLVDDGQGGNGRKSAVYLGRT
jgi:predicted transcriptional regulator